VPCAEDLSKHKDALQETARTAAPENIRRLVTATAEWDRARMSEKGGKPSKEKRFPKKLGELARSFPGSHLT